MLTTIFQVDIAEKQDMGMVIYNVNATIDAHDYISSRYCKNNDMGMVILNVNATIYMSLAFQ